MMRPFGPVPLIVFKSIAFSAAILAAIGETISRPLPEAGAVVVTVLAVGTLATARVSAFTAGACGIFSVVSVVSVAGFDGADVPTSLNNAEMSSPFSP